MKKAKSKNLLFALLLGTLAIMLILTSTIGNVSAYNAAPKKLIVKGSSEITFKPDSANVCVGVETVNSNVTTAQKENAETMRNTLTGFQTGCLRICGMHIRKRASMKKMRCGTRFFPCTRHMIPSALSLSWTSGILSSTGISSQTGTRRTTLIS